MEKIKIYIIFILALFFNISIIFSATITAIGSGDWTTAGIWDTGTIPTSADDVVIPNTRVVTITASRTLGDLTIDNGGQLQLASNVTATFYKVGNVNFVVNGTVTTTSGVGILKSSTNLIMSGTTGNITASVKLYVPNYIYFDNNCDITIRNYIFD